MPYIKMAVSVGIEISEEYLKLVLAQRKGVKVKLLDCFVMSLAALNDANIARQISEIIKKNRVRSKLAVISLPRNLVTLRNLHLPSHELPEIAKMIELHISRIVPYKKDEIVYSYNLGGTDELNYSRVMLAIVYNNIISRQIKIIDMSGFLVDKIVLSSYGSWRWIYNRYRSKMNPKEMYLILDVDATFTDFIIFNSEAILFSRSISLKADALDGDLGKTKLLGEIRQSLLIFYNEEINKKPAKVFITGGVNEAMAAVVEKELDINTEFVESYFSEEFFRSRNKDLPRGVSLTALSQLISDSKESAFSFTLPEIEIRKSLRDKTKDLIVFGSCLVYLLGTICAIFIGRIYNNKAYLQFLEARSYKVEEKIGKLAGQMDKIEFTNNYLKLRKLPLFVISRIQRVIPDNISVSLLRIEADRKITLRGSALMMPDIFNLVNDLQSIEHLTDVQTRYTRKKKLRDREVTDFEISLFLNL